MTSWNVQGPDLTYWTCRTLHLPPKPSLNDQTHKIIISKDVSGVPSQCWIRHTVDSILKDF